MNKGAFFTSLVQQMGGNPSNWWINMNNSTRPSHEEISSASLSSLSSSHSSYSSNNNTSSVLSQYSQPYSYFVPMMNTPWNDNSEQPQPESWSQLLLGGMAEDERYGASTPTQSEFFNSSNGSDQEINGSKSQWNQLIPVSSPKSCITTSLGSNMLDFSNCVTDRRPHQSDNSSECNSTATGSSLKKARVQVSSSAQSTLKVRKERLGDRITALHQIVSPFGKTDTASVLQETIGYIRFLLSQIEALSNPYLGCGSGKTMQTGQGERNCLFPEYQGQHGGKEEQMMKDLKSRGLCLVPVSYTSHLGSDSGADYWPTTTLGGGFGR